MHGTTISHGHKMRVGRLDGHKQNQVTHDSNPHIYKSLLRNDVMKGSKQQTDNMLSKHTDKFTKIHNNAIQPHRSHIYKIL